MPFCCARCKRAVGEADEILAVGRVWHLQCFSCCRCRCLLDECCFETDGFEVYCQKCYGHSCLSKECCADDEEDDACVIWPEVCPTKKVGRHVQFSPSTCSSNGLMYSPCRQRECDPCPELCCPACQPVSPCPSVASTCHIPRCPVQCTRATRSECCTRSPNRRCRRSRSPDCRRLRSPACCVNPCDLCCAEPCCPDWSELCLPCEVPCEVPCSVTCSVTPCEAPCNGLPRCRSQSSCESASSCCVQNISPDCCQSGGSCQCSSMSFHGQTFCRRCNKRVYHAEMKLASGSAFHDMCFSCFVCRKPLEVMTMYAKDGEIFCRLCLVRNFGPVGYGYGQGAGVLQTPD